MAVVLAACSPAPPFEEQSGSLPAAAAVSAEPLDGQSAEGAQAGASESDTVLADGPGNLVERLPNTCQLDNYRQFVGQDGLLSASQVIDRPARVIAPDAIVSQVYDPQRVNFYTDAQGQVARVSCG